jgi:hypothetical protein
LGNIPEKRSGKLTGEAFKLGTSHGYLFNSNFFLGAGAELDIPGFSVPVFVDFKYSPLKKRFSPFIRQQLGYTFYPVSLSETKQAKQPYGGPFTETGVGARIYISSKVEFFLAVGYRLQDITEHAIAITYLNPVQYVYPYFGGWGYYTKPPTKNSFYHSISLTAGFSF